MLKCTGVALLAVMGVSGFIMPATIRSQGVSSSLFSTYETMTDAERDDVRGRLIQGFEVEWVGSGGRARYEAGVAAKEEEAAAALKAEDDAKQAALDKEKAEKEAREHAIRMEAEKKAAEAQAKLDAERKARELQEEETRQAAIKMEAEKQAKAAAEAERAAKEKHERELAIKMEAEKKAAEELKLKVQKEEEERQLEIKAAAEREAKAAAEAERELAIKMEAEKKAAEELKLKAQKEEEERQLETKAAAERETKDAAEAERAAKEKQEEETRQTAIKMEAEKKAAEELKLKAQKEEEERQLQVKSAAAEAEKKAKAEEEQKIRAKEHVTKPAKEEVTMLKPTAAAVNQAMKKSTEEVQQPRGFQPAAKHTNSADDDLKAASAMIAKEALAKDAGADDATIRRLNMEERMRVRSVNECKAKVVDGVSLMSAPQLKTFIRNNGGTVEVGMSNEDLCQLAVHTITRNSSWEDALELVVAENASAKKTKGFGAVARGMAKR